MKRLQLREQQPMTRTLLESQGNTLKETWNGLQIGTGIGDHTQQYLDSNLSVILNTGEAQEKTCARGECRESRTT